MDVYSFAKQYLYPFKVKGNEIIPKLCPICQGGEHHDKETFALNTEKKTYNCLRGSCGVSGHFKQLCDHFGEKYVDEDYNMDYKKKTYVKPKAKIESLRTTAEKYLLLRCISTETMKVFKIGQDDKDNIIFPFYENEELVFVKYRPARKLKKGEDKAWREADTKPILFGMDNCEPSFPLIITEGEIDCMSCYEVGLTNVVSIPSGTEDLTWLDTCWGWLKQFDSVTLCMDNDEAGQKLVQKLTKKLENILYLVRFPEDIKDANELLFRKGKDVLRDTLLNAVEIPVKGILRLSRLLPLDVKNISRTLSNIKQLDSSIGGFLDGEVTVWTGQRGDGKSTVVGQFMVEAVEQGKKVCAYSGELSPQWFKYWIECQMAGPNNMQSYMDNADGKEKFFIDDEVAKEMRAWYDDYFFIYDNTIVEKDESENILKVFEHAVKRYDCKVFLVDNLMTAKSGMHREDDYYRSQSNFVGELVTFARTYDCHVHLVAHPRKVAKNSLDIDCDDVAGIGDITNRVHNVILWTRLSEEKQRTNDADCAMKVLKNRSYGSLVNLLFKYEPQSRRIYYKYDEPDKKYGWEK